MSDSACHHIHLAATQELHERLLSLLPRRGEAMAEALAASRGQLRARGVTFGGVREMNAALSALVLSPEDVASLRGLAERLHSLVERLLDWLLASEARLRRYCPDHERMFSHLEGTRGWRERQVASRYDVVVSPDGQLRVMELNTGCPAGFLHSQTFAEVTREALAALGEGLGEGARFATIDPSALVRTLIWLEERAGVAPGLAAALIDENQIMHELDLLIEEFRRQGRTAEVIDARELSYRDGGLHWQGRRLSVAYNKFRISVAASENHCWKDGFEKRYRALLRGLRHGAVVAANNLCALTIGEDKSLLGLFHEPEAAALFSDSERAFLEGTVLWTRRLESREVVWRGERANLLELVRSRKDDFVIKPANEGRGFGVVIGRECDPDQWRQLCQVDPKTPRVAQEYAAPVELTVPLASSTGVAAQPVYLTLGLATLCGRYEGVLSRISPSRVTNVARSGLVQAAYVTD